MVTAATSSATEERLRAARLLLASDFPYFESALWTIALIPTPLIGGTMAVDRHWRCYYDPRLDWPVDRLKGVLMHELAHLLRLHSQRAEALNIPRDELFLWNLAADAAINGDIEAAGLQLPGEKGDYVTAEALGLEPNLTAEEYFQQLRNMPREKIAQLETQWGAYTVLLAAGDEDDTEPGPSSGKFGGSCSDGVARRYERPLKADEPGIDEATAEVIARHVAQQIKEAAKRRGTVPGGWERWADAVLGPPAVDYFKELRIAFRGLIMDGLADYSYQRPCRYQDAWDPVVGPAMVDIVPRCAVQIDTSGSMGADDLGRALCELRGVIAATGGSPVQVICTDYEVHTVQQVFDPNRIKLRGGGGTSMARGIEYLERHFRPDVIVTFTDGETDWPATPPRARHLAVIIGRKPGPPFGRTVHIGSGSHGR